MPDTCLHRHYFQSEDVVNLAQDLLGKTIVSHIDGFTTKGKIVEIEAYRAPEDKASHGYGNKMTSRTKTMFLNGGISYIYLCYGIHHLFNIVTAPEGKAHAVLIRAVEPVSGQDIMMERRNTGKFSYNLCNGPGKWTKAMGISTAHNQMLLCDPQSPVQLIDAPSVADADIIKSKRVGIGYAQECAHWLWRFRVRDNRWTSPPHEVDYPL